MTNFLNKLQWSEQILYPETHQTPSFLESLELPSALQAAPRLYYPYG